MRYDLTFLKKSDLIDICQNIITKMEETKTTQEEDKHFYKNIIDPFSAVFEASFHDISLTDWKHLEAGRQFQKTLQNEIGLFHQKVVGKIKGWKDLGTGNVVDVFNPSLKIIAEIKNKFNTTKGNHKVAIYDDLKNELDKPMYKDFTGYYVEILSKKAQNIPFVPSDNKTKTNRPESRFIREIDGVSFYALATGDREALYKIYNVLPDIVCGILSKNSCKIKEDLLFQTFFQKISK